MSQTVAIVTGVTGQDSDYLAKFLLKKGYSSAASSGDLPQKQFTREVLLQI
jgi:GDP-D-mannose dehydratase